MIANIILKATVVHRAWRIEQRTVGSTSFQLIVDTHNSLVTVDVHVPLDDWDRFCQDVVASSYQVHVEH